MVAVRIQFCEEIFPFTIVQPWLWYLLISLHPIANSQSLCISHKKTFFTSKMHWYKPFFWVRYLRNKVFGVILLKTKSIYWIKQVKYYQLTQKRHFFAAFTTHKHQKSATHTILHVSYRTGKILTWVWALTNQTPIPVIKRPMSRFEIMRPYVFVAHLCKYVKINRINKKASLSFNQVLAVWPIL